ncbi:MAG: DUF5687 family protein [Bacteroidia bacterium]|nr:DUF5687 family protein [Bacteroidia bacterium]
MIFKWFITQQFKETTRSSFWQKQIVLNIIMGLLLLIMLSYLVMLGILIDKILTGIFPDQDPIVLFNGIVLYYFAIEFLIRFFMQSLPVLNLETYLALPIRKSAIVHYVASKSIFSIGNYLSWLVFIPFAIKVIAPRYSMAIAWVWILSMILLVFTNNFLATYVKRQLAHKPWVVGIFALGLVALMAFDHFHVFSLSALSDSLMGGILKKPYLVIIPLIVMILTYLINYFFLSGRLYPDEVNLKKKAKTDSLGEIRYLKSFGLTGQLLSLDLRLLWRHKRTRSLFYTAPIFLLYGLIFYPEKSFNMASGMSIFVGIFMTGGIMINYLNYCFSYESNHFDAILAHYTDFRQYIRSKYILSITICIICFVLTIPYGLFGKHILLINTATFLYNIGFLSFVMLYLSTYSTKRMDLSRSASFNYQGLGASHWLSMLPGFLLPVLILWPFNHFNIAWMGYIVISIMGLAGLVLNKILLGVVTRQFMKNRYTMAKGFRE